MIDYLAVFVLGFFVAYIIYGSRLTRTIRELLMDYNIFYPKLKIITYDEIAPCDLVLKLSNGKSYRGWSSDWYEYPECRQINSYLNHKLFLLFKEIEWKKNDEKHARDIINTVIT